MKVGDRVRMEPMWRYEVAEGVIEKIMSDYVVVRWKGIHGQWHYTHEQADRLEVIDDFTDTDDQSR